MGLRVQDILAAPDDEALFNLLSEELQRVFSGELQDEVPAYRLALEAAPKGLRAMAGIHSLDVSMTMDDLAWHFGNHHDAFELQETLNGLRFLEVDEAAGLFSQAWEIMKPHLQAIRDEEYGDDFAEWLERTGLQARIRPLDERLRAIGGASEDYGLMNYWLAFARKHPEECVEQTGMETT